MSFQAYPSSLTSPKGRGSFNAFWKTQGLLHGNDSVLLPCAILSAGCLFALVEHVKVQAQNYPDTSTRNFLAMILVTMVPLAILEKKILECAQPVKMISKISGKVLFLHAAFLAARVKAMYFDENFVFWSWNFQVLFVSFVISCVLLPTYFGFRLNRHTLLEYKEAFVVGGLALLAAILTEGINKYLTPDYGRYYQPQPLLSVIFETCGLFMELTAFVPAVWMVCRASKGGDAESTNVEAEVAETRQRCVVFFAFLVGFYLTEDMVPAWSLSSSLPIAALGHIAHFLLLLDFAGFLLANLYDPEKLEKLMGSMLQMLADACAV
jgi:hypothetical protein